MKNLLQKICEKLTDHKYRKCYLYSEKVTPHEYYCYCRLCRYHFWTSNRPKKLPGQKCRMTVRFSGKPMTLNELPVGTLFMYGSDCIAIKSEYRADNGLIEAYILGSGELFWGGASTVKEQSELLVQPLEIPEWERDNMYG